ncbi:MULTISPECIES: hypothetical protein [Actinoalloteichus]|uniref:Uncharacterized protein n=1 Tax=Actinoalloteichus fjordicus TaxID=1612552 RepID=A0AAC9LGL4_9PSEU|nr:MULTISPECIES: hypothetical protein [Actinoalloteichus]APU16000.1 hypothetical protein UA74_19875 [Actinoalloteichus fjordicus]APU22063.1 hypothetical protein UA75_20370 [Actinoalloteichus sp. GBA129-24]
MADTTPPRRTDEDEFVIPRSWYSIPRGWQPPITPRRGGEPRAVTVDADASADLSLRITRAGRLLDVALSEPGSPGELVEAARATLAGRATPLGAAVVAAVVTRFSIHGTRGAYAEIADAWTQEHGIVFAAEAACLLARIAVSDEGVPLRLRTASSEPAEVEAAVDDARSVLPVLVRMRALLAGAEDGDYAKVVETLSVLRQEEAARVLVSFLVPTLLDWVDADCAASATSWWPLLIRAVSTKEQLTTLAARVDPAMLLSDRSSLFTVVSAVGPAAASVIAAAFDSGRRLDQPDRQRLVDTLALLPSDEAFDLIFARGDQRRTHPALSAMMRRFPARAVRRLAAAATGESTRAGDATRLLRRHVVTARSVVESVLPELPAAGRALVESVIAAVAAAEAARPAAAPDSALPDLLIDPPWRRQRDAVAPVVQVSLTSPAPAVSWADGEQQEWAATPLPADERRWPPDTDWAREIETLRAGRLDRSEVAAFFVQAPREQVAPLLPRWDFRWRIRIGTLRLLAAAYGPAATTHVVHHARGRPDFDSGLLLLPFVSGQAAELVAAWLSRTEMRPHALTWLDRHGAAAVLALVPAALGPAGTPRRQAEQALRIAAAGRIEESVTMVEAEFGAQAASAVRTLMEISPLDDLPDWLPALPGWLHLPLLPPILLRGRADALPASAVEHVLTMLAMSHFGWIYPGVEEIRRTCDPVSLAEFGWAVFLEWQRTTQPGEGSWVLPALGAIGDDETVRQLAPLIREWPGDGWHLRAVDGVNVLAGIGTDLALLHLHSLSQRLLFAKPRGGTD